MKQYNIFGKIDELDEDGNRIVYICQWCEKEVEQKKEYCSLDCERKKIENIFKGITGNI
jgi:DNA-directed RNA polymerase subunit RPC12/RpoP